MINNEFLFRFYHLKTNFRNNFLPDIIEFKICKKYVIINLKS